ncbi:RutC family protein PYRAB12510 [Waddlia chondrophila 2032/99]|uniref:RutC family protein PYRAB12510 n=1 Tax=Waddlia chondrophila 2032/99 TaxID=765953 RepID=F8LED0_9BACT|nr:RutC family protein PYRAB12510 [Waddlia chondrophila 2032/99]
MLEIKTDCAPKALGPYSQGIKVGNFLFVSGQVPLDPQTGNLVEGGIAKQVTQVIDNLESVLKAGGADLSKVVRVDIFLTDLNNDFPIVNEIYSSRFIGSVKPARQTVEVSKLPMEALVEMSCVAYSEEA